MAAFRMIEPEDTQPHQFETEKPVYAYIRFSTMGQVKNSKQSRVMQDTRMEEKLVRPGFKDRRKMDRDEGISAQKGTDKRLDLDKIYKAMERGECGGIAAWDASRLWRDRDRVYFNDFIKKIRRYNVPVIFHDRTYWPKIDKDMEALRGEFEYAAKDLEHMYEKVNPARQEAVLGGSYGGHAVPPGFALIGEKGDKHYIPYQPHTKLINQLFKRYRQLDGNLGRLGRELVLADFHLPDFDKDELRAMGAQLPHISLTHDSKGYKLQSRNGLISVLTNRAYIGWYVYNAKSEESKVFQGEYINKTAHEAIVELDDFLFAYNRLSKTTLDGEPNENKPAVNRHYAPVKALLEGCLTNNGVPCYATKAGAYIARLDNDGWKSNADNDGWKSNVLYVKIAEVDKVFTGAMIEALARIELEKSGATKTLAAKVEALKAEQEEKVDTLTGTLEDIDKAIREWELAKKVAMAEESEPDVTEAIRNLKRLRGKREAIEQQAKRATSEVEELAECGDLLDCAKRDWNAMKFEKQQRLVKLLVGYANIEEVSPHIFKLTVALIEPISMVLTCYLWRADGSREKWTDSENAELRKLYPTADRAIVLEALPTRTWESIISQCCKVLKIERATRVNTSSIENTSTVADEKIIETLGTRDMPHWTIDTDVSHVEQLVRNKIWQDYRHELQST